ncbi:hypothetical protein ACFL6L_04815, partial [candidate division KSB1 bacterium]
MRLFKGLGCTFVVAVCILFISMNTADAQGDKFSFRMRGIGQGLYGFVDDLYSDLSFNPSYIKRYQGTTLFSNISNLQGKSEQSLFSQDETDFTLMRNTDVFPSNLIGTVTDRFGLPVGFFWESQGYNITLSDDKSDEVFSSLTDGTFNASKIRLGADFSGHSFSVIGIVKDFGVSVSYHRLGFDLNFEEEDLSQMFTANDSTGLRENNESLLNTTKRTFKFPNSMFGFSIGRVIKQENSEYSFSVGRRPERVTFDANGLFDMFKEPF